MLTVSVDGPRFQKVAVWKKAAMKSFEFIRSRSFEIIGGLLGSFNKDINAKENQYACKALPFYQDQNHFFIESLGFTAVLGDGGYFLFRPQRCQLCKMQTSIATAVSKTRRLSWTQVYDYREKLARMNSERAVASTTSSSSIGTFESATTGVTSKAERRDSLKMQAKLPESKGNGRVEKLLNRGESTELTRTTRRVIREVGKGRREKKKWRGPGSMFMTAVHDLFFKPQDDKFY